MTPQQLADWVAETPESIAARLDGAKAAQRQTQFTLGMMALVFLRSLPGPCSFPQRAEFDGRQ